MDDIKFETNHIPQQRLSTITAYINEISLMENGKKFLHHVLAELVRQSVLVHRIEIDNMVTDYIMSDEVKEYIKAKIRESIDITIQQEVSEIFKRDV